MAGCFGINSKNETARYSIFFATHSDSGLTCWNPVKWGLDPAAGRAAFEKRGIQPGLWDERGPLRDALTRRVGSAVNMQELLIEATRLGFREAQLRQTLDELRQDGQAIREAPLDSRTPWPNGCTIRLYPAPAP